MLTPLTSASAFALYQAMLLRSPRTPGDSAKVFVLGSLNLISLSNGIIFGQAACVISSLQKNEEGIQLTEGQISLIASLLIITNVLGFGLGAFIADKFGRRWSFSISSILVVINWIVLYRAKDFYEFVLSRIIGGIAVGALWKLVIFVTAEYTSSKTRAFFLNMVTTVSPAIGTALIHVIGNILHWRTVTLISIIPSVIGAVIPYFWVESPHWLASRRKFEECQTAFRKLHGNTTNSERELLLLLKMETAKFNNAIETNSEPTFKRLLIAFKRKYFWELLLMSMFMHAYIAAGSKLVFTSLAMVMLKDITGTSDVLLFTLLVDSFMIIGSCISLFIRKTSVRTLLFSTGFAANVVIVIFSFCFYFRNGQTYFNWINVCLLAMFFILVNSGPYPLLDAIFSEMFPLELKLYIFSISGVVLVVLLSLTIFLFPYIVNAIGYHGLFLMNAGIMTISLGYMWVKWPETKGRTLQEIEVYFKANNFDVEEVLSKEQTMNLII
ncbi:glucose transporter GlcP-like [Bicyclus anynana]|uniref:Glucose transporter GlcP-like n=1 Tax=Bicyclus anynana TaxID=110368 RepID=A0ABM3M4M4_BICAN|nr:glucose transporter GlcP-like [Bicyclus anynana]